MHVVNILYVQPAEVIGLVEIPSHIRFWGFDSGIRHRYWVNLDIFSKDFVCMLCSHLG